MEGLRNSEKRRPAASQLFVFTVRKLGPTPEAEMDAWSATSMSVAAALVESARVE